MTTTIGWISAAVQARMAAHARGRASSPDGAAATSAKA